MNKQNFKTQLYQLNNYENEQSEVIYAGNPNSKEVIVFIHGALLTYKIMTMFEPYMREYKLIFINCPSRGKSSEIERDNHTLDDYSERVYDVLSQIVTEQHLSEIKVVGYSMGGMIATRLLKFNTLPISHLIYLNSAAKITPDGSMLARLFTSDSKRDILKDEIDAVKNLPQYILDKTIFAQKENAIELFQFVAPIKTIITDILYTINADYLPDIEDIETFPKILFMSGKEDQIIPYTDSQATLEQFKIYGGTTKEIVYEGIGHLDFPSVLETKSDQELGVVDHIKQWIQE
ncbi:MULTISPECIES: alpha/beta fold hydrolase [Staphylococcus]|jgi:pimeloyl-ACP methyl ester carboxylesterase|uniref:alpha/beta fold hydrolase n=1 Tax=Staphylococcus TaxID=1279 RepID=UPI0001A5C684|nr:MULTISPECIES: alpha/beta hydrolase [Staphylococcus]EEQ80867.1 hydrolase, alpha/beta domain protein [Staphylococcus warneri L37603]MBO0377249.1 alpha/beta hydrolase [Staphylococcus warneri]MCI2747921.1 alpha/beta hydrolase [Staphylococcus warneri]MCI2776356.1 alpha/beta hydrolase [Staphylococcus warneri]MCJ1804070.1 alpha/beta hydrolase [Staphylococcus warneri]